MYFPFYIFQYDAEYGAKCSAESGAKLYFIGAIAQTEKKQGKLTCVSIPSENSNIKKQKLNKNKTSLAKQVFFSINQTPVANTLLIIKCRFTIGSVIYLV